MLTAADGGARRAGAVRRHPDLARLTSYPPVPTAESSPAGTIAELVDPAPGLVALAVSADAPRLRLRPGHDAAVRAHPGRRATPTRRAVSVRPSTARAAASPTTGSGSPGTSATPTSSTCGSAGTSTGTSSPTSTAATTRPASSCSAARWSTRCSPGWRSIWPRCPSATDGDFLFWSARAAGGRRAADRRPAGLAGRAAVLVVRPGPAAGALRVPQLGPVRGLRDGGGVLGAAAGAAASRGDRARVRSGGAAGDRPGPAAGAGRGRAGCRRRLQALPDDVRAAGRAVAGHRRLADRPVRRTRPRGPAVAGRGGLRGRHRRGVPG